MLHGELTHCLIEQSGMVTARLPTF